MSNELDRLLSPASLAGLTLRNRMIKTATFEGMYFLELARQMCQVVSMPLVYLGGVATAQRTLRSRPRERGAALGTGEDSRLQLVGWVGRRSARGAKPMLSARAPEPPTDAQKKPPIRGLFHSAQHQGATPCSISFACACTSGEAVKFPSMGVITALPRASW